jgi:hypothetical protein
LPGSRNLGVGLDLLPGSLQILAECLTFETHVFGLVCPSYTPFISFYKTPDLSLLHGFLERQD